MSKTPERLFHYTVGPKLPLILNSGSLVPKGYGMAASSRERPVLWLSENPVFEPTANKVISTDGGKTFIRPSLAELHDAAGIFRFQVDPERLMNHRKLPVKLYGWAKLQQVAHFARKDVSIMVDYGMKMGATPMHWWGAMEPIFTNLLEDGILELQQRSAPALGEGPNVWHSISLEQAVDDFLARGVHYKMTTATETPQARGI